LFIAAAVLIVGAERLQGLFLGGFYWRHLSHSQYANLTVIQIADIFGAAGVSFLVAMVNGTVAELVIASTRKRLFSLAGLLKAGVVCVAVAGAVVYGRWRINQSARFVEQGPLVGVVQSNIPQSVKESPEAADKVFDEMLGASTQAVAAGAELVIWPETMVLAALNSGYLQFLRDSSPARIFDKALGEHAKDNAYLLIGAHSVTVESARVKYVVAEKFNSAFLYTPDGRQGQKRYDKIHLVPFGEVVPFRKTAPWLHAILMKFTPYDYDYSLNYGKEYTVFDMASGKAEKTGKYNFAVMICYEDAIPAIARKFALDERGDKRLDWLVNISNDGWFVRLKDGSITASTELAQHTAICAFRAVENRLTIVRSVNTGISCLIDSTGRVRDGFAAGTLPYDAMAREAVAGWLAETVPIDDRVTVFSKYGQWLDFCCACVLVLTIILQPVEYFVRKKGIGEK